MGKNREYEGRTLREALDLASTSLGIAEPDLDYEILEQGRRGLFGLGAKAVRIRVMPPLDEGAAGAGGGTPGDGRPRRKRRRSRRRGGGRAEGEQAAQPAEEKSAEPATEVADGEEGERPSRRRRRRGGRRRGGRGRGGRSGDKPERSRGEGGGSRSRRSRPSTPVEAPDDQVAKVHETATEIAKQTGIDVSFHARAVPSGVELDCEGPDTERLGENDAELLGALRFVLNRMGRRSWPDSGRVSINCDGATSEIDEELLELVREVAGQVRESGEPKRLHPMNAYERRLVHIEVRRMPGVLSDSEGDGEIKQVWIRPDGEAASPDA